MFCYKVKGGRVKCVECEKMEYPLYDSDGDCIYINTHFATEEEAHRNAIERNELKVKRSVNKIRQVEDVLKKAKDELVEACKVQQDALSDYEKYKMANDKPVKEWVNEWE